MEIKYISKFKAEKLIPDDKTLLISFRDPKEKVYLKDGWKNIVVIECDDLDPDELIMLGAQSLAKEAKFFSKEDAKKILDKFEEVRNEINSIVIHCKAGVSRSGAAAKFFAGRYGQEINPRNPNPLIYKLLKEVSESYK